MNNIEKSLVKRALYAGSFDPPSSGHLDIIKRAIRICDTLIVGIAYNPMKKSVFSYEEREQLLMKMTGADGDKI